MSSSNLSAIIFQWNEISTRINSSFAIFLFIFGTIGNILNVLVLSQRTLRSNPCAWLFYVCSIFNLISIVFGLTTRLLPPWFGDITDQIQLLCQLRVFVLLTSRTIASWLIALAIFDRWLLSSVDRHYRDLSTLNNAKRGMMIIMLLSILIHSAIFYCYKANLSDTPLKCYSKTISCRIYADQIYTFITIIVPLIVMILYGLLTTSNVRKMHHRVQISSQLLSPHERLKSIDRHLLIMLLVQITFLTILTLPQALEMIYLTITTNQVKSPLQNTIENSVFTFSLLLTYLASGMTFYTYTLTGGRVFREESFNLLRSIVRQTTCREIMND